MTPDPTHRERTLAAEQAAHGGEAVPARSCATSRDCVPVPIFRAEKARADAAVEALAGVWALQREWYGRATEATSEPLSWRRVSRDLHALLPADTTEDGRG